MTHKMRFNETLLIDLPEVDKIDVVKNLPNVNVSLVPFKNYSNFTALDSDQWKMTIHPTNAKTEIGKF